MIAIQPKYKTESTPTNYGYKWEEQKEYRICPECHNEYHGENPILSNLTIYTATGKTLLDDPWYKCSECGHAMESRTKTVEHYYDKDWNELSEEPETSINNKAKTIWDNIVDFFYEEKQNFHEEIDENGETIIVEDEPTREVNFIKVGACSTSITLLIIGIIITIVRKCKK